MTLFLDADLYKTPGEFHAALKRLLNLPDYYGGNADALHDVLSERLEPTNLYVRSQGTGDVARAVDLACAVVSDLGGKVTRP